MNHYQQTIESLLFFENQPLSYPWLSRHLGISITNTKQEVQDMLEHYKDRGVSLLISDSEVSLVTHKSQAERIQGLKKQEDSKELSKQSLETLAIILFKKQLTKAEIDYIRGVNSIYILRNLSTRGLINKKANLADKRSPFYTPSLDLLNFLGIHRVEELNHYSQLHAKLNEIEQQYLKEQEGEIEAKDAQGDDNLELKQDSDHN